MPGKVCAPLLRKKVQIDELATAFLYVNSLGYHEVYVNGKKVTENVLTPAVSQLNKRSLMVTYDVSSYLKEGENDLLIWLGQGWYKKTTFGAAYDGPLVKAELDMLKDGKWKVLTATDTSWSGRESGYSDIGNWCALQFGGERVDGRIVPTEFSTYSLDKMKWYPVVHEVTMEYSDNLTKEGDFDKQGESDVYISGGRRGEYFRNKFNHHAYRYVRISNLPVGPKTEWIKSLQIYGDYRQTATFECSDADLNAIHNMIQYTMKCLTFSGYMVDCPHLERAGYGGDGNSSTMSLQTMYDVAPTFTNWIQTWGDSMRDGGSLAHVGPNPGAGGGGPYWCGFIVQAPWRTYVNYDDSRLIKNYYPKMKEWFSYVDKYTVDGLLKRWPDTQYRDWYLGDWLAPMGVDAGAQSSVDLVNNCFISECLGTMEKIALILREEKEAQEFAVRRKNLNELIHQTFYHPSEGIYSTGSQLDMCYPMLVGAVPDSLYDDVKRKMMTDTEKQYKGHIAVGLVGVPILTEWAIRNREVDFLYQMLKKRDYPGYLYMIDNGATATWESWNGERSRVHNCYNGIGAWFYQAIGGLRMDETAPGYRHVFIDPQIPEGVTWAKMTKDTPYGVIAVDWELTDNIMTLQVDIPAGVTATLCIPDGAVACKMNGKNVRIEKKTIQLNAGNLKYYIYMK